MTKTQQPQPKPGDKGPRTMTLSVTTSGAIPMGKASMDAQRQKPKEDK